MTPVTITGTTGHDAGIVGHDQRNTHQEGSRNIAALQEMDVGTLIAIPQQALLSGSSAIRNWVTLAAMVEKFLDGFIECPSVNRALLGTEIGLHLMPWR